jgi:prepilin-type processing-associated H-X9-DG protein
VGSICSTRTARPLSQRTTAVAARVDRIGIGWLGTASSAWLMATNIPTIPRGKNSDAVPGLAAGVFALNRWLNWHDKPDAAWLAPREPFRSESNITQPTLTPVICDGVLPWVWPRATDWLPVDVYRGVQPSGGGVLALSQMQLVAIARHGRRAAGPPGRFNPGEPLPGRINMTFFDGHVSPVPLDGLWDLAWHRDYEAPKKRPRLN